MPPSSRAATAQLPRTRAPEAAADPAAAGRARRSRSSLPRMPPSAASAPWIGARDLAILLLLYGAGLRVAEALSLTARVLPIGTTLRVTGKRSKTRIVPVVPAVREAIEDYARQCPYPLNGDAPLFVGARGGPLNPDLVRRSVAAARQAAGLARHADPARAAPQLRDPFAGARSGLARAPGVARPREPVVDPDLHGGGRGAPARRLSPRPPPRLSRGP